MTAPELDATPGMEAAAALAKLLERTKAALGDPHVEPADAISLLALESGELRRKYRGPTFKPPGFIDELHALEADESIVTPPVIVEGLLRQGERAVLGGASKSFKSWGTLDLAFCVAAGIPWLGRETHQGVVWYVNLELPRWAVRKRLGDIADAHELAPPVNNLFVWTLRDIPVTPEALREHFVAMRLQGLKLVAVDPVYKLLNGRDENSAADMAALLAPLGGICLDTGAALATNAHFAKGNAAGKEAMDRISGSGVFSRDPDSLLTLTRHEEEGCFTVETSLRTFAPAEPFVIRWKHPLFHVEAGLDPENLRTARKPGRPPFDETKLLPLLPPSGLPKPEWRKAAGKRLDIVKTTFYEAAAKLIAAGRVEETADGLCVPVAPKAAPLPYADA